MIDGLPPSTISLDQIGIVPEQPSQAHETRIRALDGWRGLAILGVLLDHFVSARGLNFGRFGVELFFVLSGRLMAEILFIRRMRLKTFFFRRFTRIYPALFVVCSIIFLIFGLIHPLLQPVRFAAFLSAITLTANYFSIYGYRTEILDHIWSLCIEEHMYILLGCLAAISRAWNISPLPVMLALAGLFIGNGAIQTWAFDLDYFHVFWRSDVRGASILIGATCFLLLQNEHRYRGLLEQSWAPVMFGVIALMLNLNIVPDPIKYSAGTVCLALSVVLITQAPQRLMAILQSKPLVYCGIWSFSVYLVQQPFAVIGLQASRPSIRLLEIPLVFLCAALCFYVVERPARRWLNRKSLGRVPSSS